MPQMRKTYQTTNRKLRAQQLRQAAQECQQGGAPGLAEVNWQEADWIDPPMPEEDMGYR